MQQQNKVRSDEVQRVAVGRELVDEELAGVVGGANGTPTGADQNNANSNGADPNGNGLNSVTSTQTDPFTAGLLGGLLGNSSGGLLSGLLGGDPNNGSASPFSVLGL